MYTHKQLSAIKHPVDRNLRIIAPPGSGKTECVTERTKHIIETTCTDDSKIWLTTFSNKAAKELKDRLKKKLGRNTSVYATNLHKACIRLLRMFAEEFPNLKGVPSRNFTIIDTKDEAYLIDKFYNSIEKLEDGDFENGSEGNDYEGARQTQQHFSFLKSRYNQDPKRYLSPVKYKLWRMLEEHCIANDLFSFDDLINRTAHLLETHPELLGATNELIEYILVDEYQDISSSQEHLITLIRGDAPITIVGDQDQSIFGFRGADKRNLMDFATKHKADTIVLDTNFRSSQDIVRCTSWVFSDPAVRKPTRSVSVPFTCEYNSIRKVPTNNREDEAKRLVHEIKTLSKLGHPLNDIAILYRNHYHANELAKELLVSGIPHHTKGKFSYWDRKEIRTVLAYINLAINPNNIIAFNQVARNFQGIGEATINECVDNNFEDPLSALQYVNAPAYWTIKNHVEALCYADDNSALFDLIADDNAFGTLMDFDPDKTRHDNIKTLSNIISAIEWEDLTDLNEALYIQRDMANEKSEGVQLMTMHSSKGCEFSIVFLIGFSRGCFPGSSNSVNLEEEERLCFVAMTRAKHLLYLMCNKDHPSMFLKRIPRSAVYDASISPDFCYKGTNEHSEQEHKSELKQLRLSLQRGSLATHFKKIEKYFDSLVTKLKTAEKLEKPVDVKGLEKEEFELLTLDWFDSGLHIQELKNLKIRFMNHLDTAINPLSNKVSEILDIIKSKNEKAA